MEDSETRQALPYMRTMGSRMAGLLVLLGLVMFVIAQFPSETEAEPLAVWDWARHGVCFLGGVLVCLGIMRRFDIGRQVGRGIAVFSVVIGIMLALFAHLVMEDYFDEGLLVGELVPIWLIQHAMIFIGGLTCYVGLNRFYEDS
jgi:peptidoglycan/LPS O-acetylase OafA/YrhL